MMELALTGGISVFQWLFLLTMMPLLMTMKSDFCMFQDLRCDNWN